MPMAAARFGNIRPRFGNIEPRFRNVWPRFWNIGPRFRNIRLRPPASVRWRDALAPPAVH